MTRRDRFEILKTDMRFDQKDICHDLKSAHSLLLDKLRHCDNCLIKKRCVILVNEHAYMHICMHVNTYVFILSLLLS